MGWYNGLPEYADLNPNLEAGEEAVIIGQGNVALDIARTLLCDSDRLRTTDMTEQAVATIAKSRVKRVRVVGRRGPMQVSHLTVGFRYGSGLNLRVGIVHHQRSSRIDEAPLCQLSANQPKPASP